jgi:integrase
MLAFDVKGGRMSVRKRIWKNADGGETTRWTVDIQDANGHRERRQFDSRKEADAFRIATEGQMRAGTFRGDAAKFTVTDAATLFLDYCEGRRKRGERMTQRNYDVMDGHIGNYICRDPNRPRGKSPPVAPHGIRRGIGGIKLSQLTTRSVNDFRDRLRDAGVTVVTTRKILSTLQQLLGYAVNRDMIGINVAKGVKVIGRRDEGARKIVPPTKEAMRALLSVANRDFRVKLAFASAVGVRAGELHALRWHHLDLAKGEVKVETRVDVFGEEDVTKTTAGMRTIPLSQPLVLMLKEWKLRTKRKKAGDLLFPNDQGSYTNHDNMVKRKFLPLFGLLAKKYAEERRNSPPPERFNWHALRHFAVSCWIDAGLSPKTVQTFAGHSGLQVTMDRYGDLFKSDDHKKAMDEIAADMFGQNS